MKKLLLLILLHGLLLNLSQAQLSLAGEKRYLSDGAQPLPGRTILKDRNKPGFFTSGECGPNLTRWWNQIDENGNVVSAECFQDSLRYAWLITPTHDGGYIMSIAYPTSPTEKKYLIRKTDSQFKTQWEYETGLSAASAPVDIVELEETFVISSNYRDMGRPKGISCIILSKSGIRNTSVAVGMWFDNLGLLKPFSASEALVVLQTHIYCNDESVAMTLSPTGQTSVPTCLNVKGRPVTSFVDTDGSVVIGLMKMPAAASCNGFITKLDKNLKQKWRTCIDGNVRSIINAKSGGYFVIGSTRSSPEKGLVATVSASGSIERYDTLNLFSPMDLVSAAYTSDGNLLISAYSTSAVSNRINVVSFIKVRSLNSITAVVFIDTNNNGIRDAGEGLLQGAQVEITSAAGAVFKRSVSEGSTSFDVGPGTYTTRLLLPNEFYDVSATSKQTVFNDYQQSDTVTFALRPKPSIRDLGVSIVPVNFARPGFEHWLKIIYRNNGTESLDNVALRFVKDTRSQFVSSDKAHTYAMNDTIIWNVGTLSSRDTGSITLQLQLKPPPVLSNGDILQTEATILPQADDRTPFDNISRLTETVRGSYDPNDKIENRNGILSPDELTDETYLTYTIRFQNTGTDTAFGVVVRDTLEDTQRRETLEMISASHNYTLTINEGKYVTWTFNNIHLPDSNVNEPASHGYITYRIKPDSTLAVGSSIKNTASIYFDYNLPVKTAAAVTVIRPERPVVPVITAPGNSFCSNAGVQKFKVQNVPEDPYTYSGKLDNNTISIGADSTVSVDPSTLSVGEHKLVVSFSNGFETTNSEVAFSVVAAQTPGVSLGASATALNKDVTTSTLTATAGSAAGNGAQFTFAKDREFTSILRAESEVNTFTVSGSDLTSGNNRLYVRMRSSEVCLTATIAIDSIDITLDTTTTQPPPPPPPPPTPSSKGFVDPEYPNMIINIFPNPVDDHITIRGLQPSKQYQVRIVSINGQTVVKQTFFGSNTITIGNLQSIKGAMMVSLIDEKKGKVLGTTNHVKK
jgi:hypothetical protein